MSKERAAQLVDAGIWLRLSGDIEGARRLFERALKLDPENQRAQDLLEQAPSTVVEPTSQVPSPVPSSPAPVPPADGDWVPAGGERSAGSPSGIGEDWGRLTGRGSPAPLTGAEPALGDAPPAATGVMFSPGRGSPAPAVARVPSPPPISPSTPAPPAIAPVTPVPTLGPLGRTTIPYAGASSPSPGPTPGHRHTMMFTTDPGAAVPGLPVRQTLPFGEPEPTPAAPGSPVPQTTLVPAPPPRTTLPYSVQSPEPRVTFPPLEPTDSELGGPPRSTMVFSNSTAGPLAPSAMPDVLPVVIHIGSDDAAPGPDELVETLRAQVDAGASRGPRPTSIVLTDTHPEPSPPSASPPLFPMSSPPAPPRAASASAVRAQGAIDDAWNWSASPPPAARGLPSDEGMPTPRPSPGLAPQASSGWDQRGTPGIKIDDMVGPDNALEFVSTGSNQTRSPEADREEVETLLRGARDLIDLDDHTGAMELIARAQALAPDDPQVQQLRERSERTLLAMFESKLGHLDKVPRVMLKDDEIIWLNLDHRAGFVLAQIDGTVSFEDLFAVSGMSRLDTARILAQLVDEGVISRG